MFSSVLCSAKPLAVVKDDWFFSGRIEEVIRRRSISEQSSLALTPVMHIQYILASIGLGLISRSARRETSG